MQAITFTMDAPKLRGGNFIAAIGGMLAVGSVMMISYLALTAEPEAAQWFWLYVLLGWVLLVFLVELFIYLLSLRVPFLRVSANVLLLTTTAFGFAGVGAIELPALLELEGLESGTSGLLFLLLVPAWILLAVRAGRGGTLTLGDNGLTCAVYDKRWRWAWHELPAFELRERGGLIGRILGRHLAVGDGQKALLTDVWNRPLDEVLASLNERREQALAARRDAGVADSRAEAWAGADLAEVCYRRSGKSLLRRAAGLGLLVQLPLFVLGYRYFLTYDSFAAYWAQEAGLILAAGGLILLLLAVIAAPLHPRIAARLELRFDGKGLTLGGLFRRRRRFWYDLSAFELDPGQLSRPALYFFFRGPGPHGAVESGRIGDSYEAPLNKIAAKLNDYRKQALA